VAAIALAILLAVAVVAALMLDTGYASARPSEGPVRSGKLGLGAVKVSPVDPVPASEKIDTEVASGPSALIGTVARKDAPLPAPEPAASPAPAPSTSSRSSSASPSRSTSGSGWTSARVSWYGPGFYGNTMAGGGTLQPSSMVVAHRSLAFGTRVQFQFNGKSCTATVMDRGPHVAGREFDLGPGTAKALGFSGVGTVKYRIVGR
jgi:rare lipoprotein A (peptidoglycan hydrolase)